jgi:hypothetical protein
MAIVLALPGYRLRHAAQKPESQPLVFMVGGRATPAFPDNSDRAETPVRTRASSVLAAAYASEEILNEQNSRRFAQ